MKMFTKKYLLQADPDQLEDIISKEFGGNDAVLWRTWDDESGSEMNYFHHLILHGKHEQLCKLKPSTRFSVDVRSHLSMGKNFIHLASIHINDSMMHEALTPFLEKAISEDATLLNDKTPDGLHSLALAISHRNFLMVKTLLNMMIQHHAKLSASQLIDVFLVNTNSSQKLSLSEFAKTIPGISEDIISALNHHGAHLFSMNQSEDTAQLGPFESPESFKRAVTGVGSSSGESLPGSSEYWISVLRALQLHHNNSILAVKKFTALESLLTGNEIIPPATEDLEIISKLMYNQKLNIQRLNEQLNAYDWHNPIKTLSKKMIHLEEEKPETVVNIGKFISVSLLLMELSVLAGYIYFVDTLYKVAQEKRHYLKSNFHQCVNQDTMDELPNYMTRYICEPNIGYYPCNDENEPWYDDYEQAYRECKKAFKTHISAAAGGIPLYLLNFFITYASILFIREGDPNYFKSFYPLVQSPFIYATRIFGEHNPETMDYDKQRLVAELTLGLGTFIPVFSGTEKDAIQKMVDKLNSPLNEITTKDILDSGDKYIELLAHYSTHVKHLGINSRVEIANLRNLLQSPETAASKDRSTVVGSPLLSRYRMNQSSSINLDIDHEKGLPNESSSLLGKPEKKSRCIIL